MQDKVKLKGDCFKAWSLCKNAESWEKENKPWLGNILKRQ